MPRFCDGDRRIRPDFLENFLSGRNYHYILSSKAIKSCNCNSCNCNPLHNSKRFQACTDFEGDGEG